MKVLILSHNPVSTYQNMGKTFLSLFSEFSKDELCQLYIYPNYPDVDVCSSYFRISDKDILKSYFKLGHVDSFCFDSERIDTSIHEYFADANDAKLYNKKNDFTILLRDLMWGCSHWFDAKLKQWLEEEKPTCVFMSPGSASFLYKMGIKISRYLDIPLVVYVCDEFYFINHIDGFWRRIQHGLMKKEMRKVMNSSKLLVAISDNIKTTYSDAFNIPATKIMTGSNFSISKTVRCSEHIKGLTFMGNLSYKRYESLAEIGKTLDVINEEQFTDYKLFIYSGKFTDTYRTAFAGIKAIEICGYLTGDEFNDRFLSSDALVHVEGFDDKTIDAVKNSISTKIADSLGSGIPLFCYGPDKVASIAYLKNEGCSCVVDDPLLLKTKLQHFLNDYEFRMNLAKAGIEAACRNHDSEKNSRKLYDLLDSLNV